MFKFRRDKNETGKTDNIGKTELNVQSVKVLGSGCAKCNQLEAATKIALEQLGLNITIEHVKDFAQIATYGIMRTPALVVNENVISFGKVLKPEEIIALLKNI